MHKRNVRKNTYAYVRHTFIMPLLNYIRKMAQKMVILNYILSGNVYTAQYQIFNDVIIFILLLQRTLGENVWERIFYYVKILKFIRYDMKCWRAVCFKTRKNNFKSREIMSVIIILSRSWF